MRIYDEWYEQCSVSICASLQLLDLIGCEGVSGECIVEALKRCYKRQLNLWLVQGLK